MPTFTRSYRFGSRRTTASRRSGAGSTFSGGGMTSKHYKPTQFTAARQEIQARIGSYRALNNQFSGAWVTAFSPSAASKWIKFVSTGARVYTFSATEFSRFFGSKWSYSPTTTTFKFLRKKYGTGIKAVTRGKGGAWLVAATPSVTTHPFSTYSWK
jgi:sugar/nucleoside kinase (ribokinase family)